MVSAVFGSGSEDEGKQMGNYLIKFVQDIFHGILTTHPSPLKQDDVICFCLDFYLLNKNKTNVFMIQFVTKLARHGSLGFRPDHSR